MKYFKTFCETEKLVDITLHFEHNRIPISLFLTRIEGYYIGACHVHHLGCVTITDIEGVSIEDCMEEAEDRVVLIDDHACHVVTDLLDRL